jgi:hypothetical protein
MMASPTPPPDQAFGPAGPPGGATTRVCLQWLGVIYRVPVPGEAPGPVVPSQAMSRRLTGFQAALLPQHDAVWVHGHVSDFWRCPQYLPTLPIKNQPASTPVPRVIPSMLVAQPGPQPILPRANKLHCFQ